MKVRDVAESFQRNGLLLYASAISFQVLTAVVPLALFLLGLMGFLSLTEIWEKDIRPELVDSVSIPALAVIDDTVGKVLTSKQVFWVTLGAALAVYQLSGAIRAAMEALNRVHETEDERPWLARQVRSVLLAIATLVLVLAAVAVIHLAPLAYGDPPAVVAVLLGIVRWAVAIALLILAVGLLVRYGPDRPQSLGWVSVGAIIVVGSWIAVSIAFLFYLTHIASYASIFGALATVVVLLGYLYVSSITFLVGVQTDALLRARATQAD
ncbi:MAG TPA: YihY/virulence factor BrkB family protein [Solirubrobacteraceae bacterium]|jgi:membrane protein